MSELTITVNSELEVIVNDDALNPFVVIEGRNGQQIRVKPYDVKRLADVLTGASVMMQPEVVERQSWFK